MDHELSLLGLFWEASWLVKLVMLTLLAASMVSWTIIVNQWLNCRKAEREWLEFESVFWSEVNLPDLFQRLNQQKNRALPLGEGLFYAGFNEYHRLSQADVTDKNTLLEGSSRAMRVAAVRQLADLEGGIAALATIGSVSPYVGLLGTVWGIMTAFIALGQVEQATLQMVAPGIAEALIATAMGLVAAIPAVVAYNRFMSVVETFERRAFSFMDEFAALLNRQLAQVRR